MNFPPLRVASQRCAPQLNATILLAIYRRTAPPRPAALRYASPRNSTQQPNLRG
jgi:hypothetical protein